MSTRLVEGQVIKSTCFEKGNIDAYGIIRVGNYNDNWIYSKIEDTDFYSNGIPSVNGDRKDREYLVLQIYEKMSDIQKSPSINRIIAVELNLDGTYDDNNQKISFTTLKGVNGAIDEKDIVVIR